MKRDEWAVLGALRFALAFIVLGVHITIRVYPGDPAAPFVILNQLGGIAAVIAFFLVSGYSIAASLERGADGFYRRRIVRLAPIYALGFAIAMGAELWLGAPPGRSLSPAGYALNAVGLQNWGTHAAFYFAPSWSLACEIVYYLAAPKLVQLRARWVGVLVVGSAALFAFGAPRFGLSLSLYGFATFAMFWAWLLGMALRRWRHPAVVASVVAVPPLLILFIASRQVPYQSWTLLAAGVVLVAAARVKVPARSAAALKWLGEASYPLYLLHLPVLFALKELLDVKTPMGHWAVAAVPVVVAAVAHQFVDRPFRARLGRRPAAAAEPKLTVAGVAD